MTNFESASTTAVVPLFPLPEITLLPGELMPLQVFEPRYRKLLEDALQGERLIALPRFQAGWQDSYQGNPALEPRFGVGRIEEHRPRADGTSVIVLRGIARVALVEVLRDLPYRMARVAELPETVSEPSTLEKLVRSLEAVLARAVADPQSPCFRHETPSMSVAEMPGYLTCLVRFDQATKQRILESDDQVERISIVLDNLEAEDRARAKIRSVARSRSGHYDRN